MDRQTTTGRRVSAIVTTRNSREVIETCLASIKRQTYPDVELIVVDNGSTDGTHEIALRYANRVLTAGPERSAQRNLGARIASGGLLLFVDADMELTPGVVQDCASLSARYDAVIIPEKTTGTSWVARTRQIERSSYTGSFIYEAARFVNRPVFEGLGGYDVRMTGPEDYDLEARLEERGFRVGHATALILHHEGQTSLASHLRKRAYYAQSLERYRKLHPARAGIQFGPARILHYCTRLGSSPVSLFQVVVLKSLEFASGSSFVFGGGTTRNDVY